MIEVRYFAGCSVLRWEVEHAFLSVTGRVLVGAPVYTAKFTRPSSHGRDTATVLIVTRTQDFRSGIGVFLAKTTSKTFNPIVCLLRMALEEGYVNQAESEACSQEVGTLRTPSIAAQQERD